MLSFTKSVLIASATCFFAGALGAVLPNSCSTDTSNNTARIIRLECLVTLLYSKVMDDTNGIDNILTTLDLKADTSTLSDYALLTYTNTQLGTKANASALTNLRNQFNALDNQVKDEVDGLAETNRLVVALGN